LSYGRLPQSARHWGVIEIYKSKAWKEIYTPFCDVEIREGLRKPGVGDVYSKVLWYVSACQMTKYQYMRNRYGKDHTSTNRWTNIDYNIDLIVRIIRDWDEFPSRPRLYSEQEDKIDRINRAWIIYDCHQTLLAAHYTLPENFTTAQPAVVPKFMCLRNPKLERPPATIGGRAQQR
jgi:hypothetical protein